MAGYIGSKSSVTQVDGYSEAEADAEFVTKTGDTMTGNLDVTGTVTADELNVSDAGKIGFNTTGSYTLNSVPSPDYGLGYTVSTNPINLSGYYGISFATNRAERMRIDGSGNVGIGTSSPAVQNNGAGIVLDLANTGSANTTADNTELVVRSSSRYAALSFITPTDKAATINFGDTDDANIGIVQYNHSDNAMSFYTSAAERMRIDSLGHILVGATSFSGSTECSQLHPDGTISIGANTTAGRYRMLFYNPNGFIGSIATNGSGVQFNTSSDYRLKENVVDLTGASARVNQLNPSRFNFIADADTTVDGFLAHEVATVVPEAITGTKDAMMDEEYEVTPAVEATYDDDGNELTAAVEAVMGTRSVPDYQGIDQSKLVPLLTAALQEALTEIASLKTRVEALEA